MQRALLLGLLPAHAYPSFQHLGEAIGGPTELQPQPHSERHLISGLTAITESQSPAQSWDSHP